MPTQTPLWKQLVGACAGAAIAVVVYEGFLLIPAQVQAWITLPTAPGVHQQDEVRVSGNVKSDELARIAARNKEIADRFGAESSSASSAVSLHGAASASSSAGLQGIINATKSRLASSSSSVGQSSSARVSSSSGRASRSSAAPRTVVPDPVVTKHDTPVYPSQLPSSGAGSVIAAMAAFGATFVNRRLQKQRA